MFEIPKEMLNNNTFINSVRLYKEHCIKTYNDANNGLIKAKKPDEVYSTIYGSFDYQHMCVKNDIFELNIDHRIIFKVNVKGKIKDFNFNSFQNNLNECGYIISELLDHNKNRINTNIINLDNVDFDNIENYEMMIETKNDCNIDILKYDEIYFIGPSVFNDSVLLNGLNVSYKQIMYNNGILCEHGSGHSNKLEPLYFETNINKCLKIYDEIGLNGISYQTIYKIDTKNIKEYKFYNDENNSYFNSNQNDYRTDHRLNNYDTYKNYKTLTSHIYTYENIPAEFIKIYKE